MMDDLGKRVAYKIDTMSFSNALDGLLFWLSIPKAHQQRKAAMFCGSYSRTVLMPPVTCSLAGGAGTGAEYAGTYGGGGGGAMDTLG